MPLGQSIFAPQQYNYGNYSNLSKDHYGVIQEGISLGQDKNPYWDQWLKDLTAGKLQGSPQYFSQNYVQQAAGNAALQKQQEVEQAKIQGAIGDVQGQLQGQFAQSGLSRSGLLPEAMGRVQGMEQEQLDDLRSRIENDKQAFNQRLQTQWWNERMANRERRDAKRSRKYQVASSVLGTGANIATFGLMNRG